MEKSFYFVFILVVILGASGYYYMSNQPTKVASPLPMPAFGEITVEHAAPLFADGLPSDYAIVDVRTAEEFEKIHTDKTINIPVAIFEDADEPCKDIMAKLPKDKKIIFVCPFGPRSKDMYQFLTDPVEDLGCGMAKEGLYHLWANIKYKKIHIVIKGK